MRECRKRCLRSTPDCSIVTLASAACREASETAASRPSGPILAGAGRFQDPFRRFSPDPDRPLQPCGPRILRMNRRHTLPPVPRASCAMVLPDPGKARPRDRIPGRHRVQPGRRSRHGAHPPARCRDFRLPWHRLSRHHNPAPGLDAQAVMPGRVPLLLPCSGGRLRPSPQVSASATSARARRRTIGVQD
jgi:hypothetical protein